MKIDVITLHAIKNYGSVLQAFATQELFRAHGAEVEFINYVRPDVLESNIKKTYAGNNIIKQVVMIPTVFRWRSVFNRFCMENLNLSKKQFSYNKDFKGFDENADAYCTGSDQVWNSKWNKGIILPMYLNFVNSNAYKFAFSASFGSEQLSEDEVLKSKQFIDQYDLISVREESAVRILEEQYGYDRVTRLLDPTLCLPGEFWRKYAQKYTINEDYILVYNLNRSREFDDYAIKLSKKTGLKLVRLCTRYDQFYRPGKSVLVPTIFQFISLIDNAKLVLTDSFHATAFSINMNTEPICVYPSEFGGRLGNFLKLINCEGRHAMNYDDFEVLGRHVNFNAVNNILEHERKQADEFIDLVFSRIKTHNQLN